MEAASTEREREREIDIIDIERVCEGDEDRCEEYCC